MRFLTHHFVLSILLVAAFSAASCKRTDNALRHIPGDSHFVASIYMDQLGQKMRFNETKGKLGLGMVGGILQMQGIPNFINDRTVTGIDFTQPMYVFSQESTRHAISRSSYRKFEYGDIVQLNLSAKVDGYSASIGYPVVLGKLEGARRDIVLFGREAHFWTQGQLKAGVIASDVAQNYYEYFKSNGYEENFVYGPMHGTGLIEVEAPWVETISDYPFKSNMTFQIDTFISTKDFGVRWEKGIAITEDGCKVLSPEIGKLYELDF